VLKCGNAEFSVTHYAGMVKYRVTNFVVKNRDDLPVLVGTLLSASQNRLLAALFQGSAAGTQPSRQTVAPSRRGRSVRKASARPARGNKKTPTVGSQFVTSLDLLVAKMTQANPHFVRCIKPNREAAANSWNDALVLEQLKYTGMLETIRIRREGFALRLKFADFVERYGGIGYDFTSKPPSTASSVETILRKTNISGYLVGKTKVGALRCVAVCCAAPWQSWSLLHIHLAPSVSEGRVRYCALNYSHTSNSTHRSLRGQCPGLSQVLSRRCIAPAARGHGDGCG
jgi:myosin heavy subunit